MLNLKLLGVITLLNLFAAFGVKAAQPLPNIVLIVADYMGYADIEPYGAEDINTPSLNQLAAQGVLFSNHYAAAPMCIPSRAALMSGQYPSKVLTRFKAGRGLGLQAKNNLLLSGLKSKGYKTALIGKWHLGLQENFHPNDHGFDYFFGFNSWTLGYHNHLTSDGKPGLYKNKSLIKTEGYLTDLFTEESVTFVEKNAQAPFFLYLAYNAGLPPYQPPNLPKAQWHTRWNANEASRDDYVAMIESMDQGIGKLLAKLSALKLDDNTLVIFTYDHGGRHLVNSGPLFHGFGTLWEGGIHVPLIMRWPNNLAANVRNATPSIAMDLTTTLLAVTNSKTDDKKLDGVNLLELINQPKTFENRELFWQHRGIKAMRTNDWKYIIDGHSQLLFNLSQDLSERNNLFYKHPEQVQKMRTSLLEWQKSTQ